VPLFRGRLSRLFRTRSGAREEDVVSALRDLEETLRQVEDRLKGDLLRAERVEAERPVVPAPVEEEEPEGPGPDSQAAPNPVDEVEPAGTPAPVEGVEPETIEAVEPIETVPPADPAAEHAGPIFAPRLELDVGPFADFGALSIFERELGRLPDVVGVYVRRFFGDRAIVEVTATRELPLLGLLGAALPYSFAVERVERDSLKITLTGASAEPGAT
jgi:hypothetical protein